MEFGELSKLNIVVLADNHVLRPGKFAGEYGFAAYIKAVGDWEFGILFDTGCGVVLEENMLQAGIDWKDIDYVVLSHRHFDHTGGLMKVIENCKAPIIAHPDIFRPNFLWMRGRIVNGTLPFTKSQLEARGAQFILTREIFKFMGGIAVSGEIPRKSDEKVEDMYTLEDGKFVRDQMMDDMAILARTKKGGIVITGCAHSGIINTVNYGIEVLGNVYAALGGFHLMFTTPEMAEKRMESVLEKVELAGPTHCSGSVAQCVAMKKGKFLQMGSGAVFEF
ncbi:hypothetical protein DRP04_01270 [Archaeoglobales archaeon]|nr:MAG: hypothetical protein DRP04_01270 [Archaeoglobales archaeon]